MSDGLEASALALDCRVAVKGFDGHGTVRFIGPTKFKPGIWIGIELDQSIGKNDGTVGEDRYFTCAPNHGIFVKDTHSITLISSHTGTTQTQSVRPSSPAMGSIPIPKSSLRKSMPTPKSSPKSPVGSPARLSATFERSPLSNNNNGNNKTTSPSNTKKSNSFSPSLRPILVRTNSATLLAATFSPKPKKQVSFSSSVPLSDEDSSKRKIKDLEALDGSGKIIRELNELRINKEKSDTLVGELQKKLRDVDTQNKVQLEFLFKRHQDDNEKYEHQIEVLQAENKLLEKEKNALSNEVDRLYQELKKYENKEEDDETNEKEPLESKIRELEEALKAEKLLRMQMERGLDELQVQLLRLKNPDKTE